MMTHRLQIKKETDEIQPLINYVSYNSEHLFANMMESFKRDILADKESMAKEKAT